MRTSGSSPGPHPGAARAVVALAVALAAALAVSCGKKSPPRPPEWVIPRSPAPVLVVPVANGVKVSWHRPREYADGSSLDDLGGFTVFRSCDEGISWEPIAELPVNDRERYRKNRTFAFVDQNAPPDIPCRYRVVAATLDGYRSPPAEGAVGETPEPPPSPSPSGGTLFPETEEQQPNEPREEQAPVPAPLVSATPYPPPPQ